MSLTLIQSTKQYRSKRKETSSQTFRVPNRQDSLEKTTAKLILKIKSTPLAAAKRETHGFLRFRFPKRSDPQRRRIQPSSRSSKANLTDCNRNRQKCPNEEWARRHYRSNSRIRNRMGPPIISIGKLPFVLIRSMSRVTMRQSAIAWRRYRRMTTAAFKSIRRGISRFSRRAISVR